MIGYYPPPGEILLCNFGTKVVWPEMDKLRPAVVVTPRLRRRGELVGIIPLSTTAPDFLENFHHRFELERPLPPPYDSPVMWAKCDMYSVVSRARLDRFKAGRSHGKRLYVTGRLPSADLKAVRGAMLCGLGLDSLTIHL